MNFIESKAEKANKTYLTQLWEQLHKGGKVTVTGLSAKASIAGMGGVGKSSLALAYAYEAVKHNAYNLIYWIPSETENSLKEAYEHFLRVNTGTLKGGENFKEVATIFKQQIPLFGKWLLIYDNVPDSSFLRDKIPLMGGHALITSRCTYGWESEPFDLDIFTANDSSLYLHHTIGMECTEDTLKTAHELGEELGHLPLALSHAAAYIRRKQLYDKSYGLAEYHTAFKKMNSPFETLHASVPFGTLSSLNHEYLISKTWALAGDAISPLAKKLMIYFAYLNPDRIMPAVFSESVEQGACIEDAILELSSYSLIKGQAPYISIHRLLQLAIRNNQEMEVDHLLYEHFPSILFCFADHWKIVQKGLREELHQIMVQSSRQRMSQLEEKNFEILKALEWFRAAFSLEYNLSTCYNHLQRFSQEQKAATDQILNLKIGVLALRHVWTQLLLAHNANFIIEVGPNLNADQEEKFRSFFVEQKLRVAEINANDPIFQPVKEVLPLVADLYLHKTHYYTPIAILCAKINPEDRPIFLQQLEKLLCARKGYENHPQFKSDFTKVGLTQYVIMEEIIVPAIYRDDKFKIIEALNRIPLQQWQNLSIIMRELLASKMGAKERICLINSLSEIPYERWQLLASAISKFITLEMDGYDRAIVVKAVNRVPFEAWNNFGETIKPFLTTKMEGADQALAINALSEISREQWQSLSATLYSFLNFTSGKKGLEKQRKAFNKIPFKQWEALINNIQLLVSLQIDEYGYAKIIKALSKIEPQKWESLVKGIQIFLTAKMDGLALAIIIESLNKIPSDHWPELSSYFQPLSWQIKNGSSCAMLIKALSNLSPQEWTFFISKLQDFITNDSLGDFEENFHGWLIEILSRIDYELWPSFVDSCQLLLMANKAELDNYCLINTLIDNVKPEYWQTLIKIIQPLMDDNMEKRERSLFIVIMSMIPPEQWQALAHNIPLLLVPVKMGKFYKDLLMIIMKLAPEKYRQIFISNISHLLPLEREQYKDSMEELFFLIRFFAEINSEHWEEYGKIMGFIFNTNMDLGDRYLLLRVLCEETPPETWLAVLKHFYVIWNLYVDEDRVAGFAGEFRKLIEAVIKENGGIIMRTQQYIIQKNTGIDNIIKIIHEALYK